MGAFGKLALSSAARSAASRAASHGIDYAMRRMGKSKYPRPNYMTRPYRINAQSRIGTVYHRNHDVVENTSLPKATLQVSNFVQNIALGHTEGDRNGTQIYVRGAYIDICLDNGTISDTYFRYCVANYADFDNATGDNLFADVTGNTSSAIDFSALTGNASIQTPFHKNAVGILKSDTVHLGANASTANTPHEKHIRFFVPINRVVQFEGVNPIPNYRFICWHQPLNDSETTTVRLRFQVTTIYKNIV